MITQFNKYILITEDPDTIYDDKIEYNYADNDAYPFLIKPNLNHTKVEELLIGKKGTTHAGSGIWYDVKNKDYSGRLWLDNKIMSFWVYPNPILFTSIIEEIEKHFNIKMFNNNWRIEVLMDDEKIKTSEPNDDFELLYATYYDDQLSTIIPIEDYIGSENQLKDAYDRHTLNPIEKEKLKNKRIYGHDNHDLIEPKVKGFGSDLTRIDGPRSIYARDKEKTSENKNQ